MNIYYIHSIVSEREREKRERKRERDNKLTIMSSKPPSSLMYSLISEAVIPRLVTSKARELKNSEKICQVGGPFKERKAKTERERERERERETEREKERLREKHESESLSYVC